VGFAGDCRGEVVGRATDGLSRCRVANFLEEFEVAMCVARFAFRGGAEYGGDIVVTFDIGLLREVEITAVGLALTCEGFFQIVFGLRAFLGH
jgi:hypothetical protein